MARHTWGEAEYGYGEKCKRCGLYRALAGQNILYWRPARGRRAEVFRTKAGECDPLKRRTHGAG